MRDACGWSHRYEHDFEHWIIGWKDFKSDTSPVALSGMVGNMYLYIAKKKTFTLGWVQSISFPVWAKGMVCLMER